MRAWSAAPPAVALLGRYALALAGPVGVAGAQFLLSLIVLHALPPAAFGRFSFLLIVAQLGLAIWSALFCATLPLLIARGRQEPALVAVTSASLIGSIAALPLLAGLARALGDAWDAALPFGVFATLALLRSFGRARAYAEHRPLRATTSDIGYAAALLAGTALIAFGHVSGARSAYLALAAATIVGMLPFTRRTLADIATAAAPRRLSAFGAVWRDHARWSLFGVVTTEATLNMHAYLITFLIGPGAFAPLAASALMIRPVGVAVNAIVEYERPRLARACIDGTAADARRALRLFRGVLLLGWSVAAVANIAILALAPGLIYPAQYDRSYLAIATSLWMVTALVRILPVPEGTLLQAVGRFRALAFASLWSSLVTLAAVGALLALAAPLWSILGLIAGEIVLGLLTLRRGRQALSQETPA